MKPKTKLVSLTDEELATFPDDCREALRPDVLAAKRRIEFARSAVGLARPASDFISDAVDRAHRDGELVLRACRIRDCRVCGESAGYATHKRRGARHDKGDPDTSKPLYLSGFDLANAFIGMVGHPTLGCCGKCFDGLRPALLRALTGVPAQLPRALTGADPEWVRFRRVHCTACDWSGHEGEMGLLDALMGGKYRGTCPQCGAANLPLRRLIIESAPGFVVVGARVPG